MTQPLVSLVITTKNEEKNIENCLLGIKNQTYPERKIETIVVDNASIDKTKGIAKRYTQKIFDKGPERSAQRNFGMKMARGDYLIYLDADMILSPTVIEKSVERLENSDLMGLYIPEVILGNSYWSCVRRFERSFYDGTVIDCVRVVRKDILEKVGGFDTTMTGPEDWDFDKKVRKTGRVELLDRYDFEEINRKILDIRYWKFDERELKRLLDLTTKPIIFHNEAKFNLKKYFEKKRYYGKSFSAYIDKWGKNDQDVKKQFGFGYRYFGVFIEKRKWKRFIKYPGLIIGEFWLRFLVGISFVINRFK